MLIDMKKEIIESNVKSSSFTNRYTIQSDFQNFWYEFFKAESISDAALYNVSSSESLDMFCSNELSDDFYQSFSHENQIFAVSFNNLNLHWTHNNKNINGHQRLAIKGNSILLTLNTNDDDDDAKSPSTLKVIFK